MCVCYIKLCLVTNIIYRDYVDLIDLTNEDPVDDSDPELPMLMITPPDR